MARRKAGNEARRKRRKARRDSKVSVRLLAVAAVALILAAASVIVALTTADGRRQAPQRSPVATLALQATPAPRPEPPPATVTTGRAATPPRDAAAVQPVRPTVTPAVPAWRANAVAVAAAPGTPLIAVIIDDMGVDQRRSARAVALPAPLTLSYLSYADNLPSQTAAARAARHELMVHVPMQPHDSAVSPGQHVLEVGMAAAEIERRLAWALDRVPGAVGANNHMGSAFTEDAAGMRTVLGLLAARGLLFVDSRTSSATAVPKVMRDFPLPVLGRDVFIDHDPAADAVRAALVEVEETARHRGQAIAIGHPRDATLAALADWLPGLAARGFALVPVSALAARGITVGRLAE
ncbi:MAG: divergent polysaccharide deacetylase family protein [Alphaproteobacteria bacterium]